MRALGPLIYAAGVERTRSSESGQAVVEAVIILPAMIFLLLCTIQLTQVQQARVMVEYAAFSAARAGIVMNADVNSMHDAASLAVLPTFGRTDSLSALARTFAIFKAHDTLLRPFGLGLVTVYVHAPSSSDFSTYGQHLNGKEIDFDDARPAVAPINLLSLQVRYLFEMRVPFANKLLQTIWLAARLGPGLGRRNALPGAGWDPGAGPLPAGTIADGIPGGINATALAGARRSPQHLYLMPVEAWYTMRTQSNFFRGAKVIR